MDARVACACYTRYILKLWTLTARRESEWVIDDEAAQQIFPFEPQILEAGDLARARAVALLGVVRGIDKTAHGWRERVSRAALGSGTAISNENRPSRVLAFTQVDATARTSWP